jgi:phosphoribosylanthranilate isomerase
MNMQELFRIKVCGVTRVEDAKIALESGADAIGLNFFPGSPRFVAPEQALSICRAIDDVQALSPLRFWKVGVFVDSDPKLISALCQSMRLDAVQLHGNETPCQLIDYRKELVSLTLPATPLFIRAIRLGPADCGDLLRQTGWVLPAIEAWTEAGAGAILLDAAAETFGGTGRTLDWEPLAELASLVNVPLILAGGLNPDNIQQALQCSGLNRIDVASGVEQQPGLKDRQKIFDFVRNSGLSDK